MRDWKEFWENYRIIDIKGNEDLLYQVGKTVKGKHISNDQFFLIIESIGKELQLSKEDTLLDLCCGNGVLTLELSKIVKSIIGVDFSGPFINNANMYKIADNIVYLHGNVINLNLLIEGSEGISINKVVLYDAIAYFNPIDFDNLLYCLNGFSKNISMIMIGSVLDKRRKWRYFNTINRKCNYLINHALFGQDGGLGRWWTKGEIRNVSQKHGFKCCFIEQNPILYTAHYRFDAILSRNCY